MYCNCGYASKDRSNFRRHLKSCKMKQRQSYEDLVECLRQTQESLSCAEDIISKRDVALLQSRQEVERLRKKLERRTTNMKRK